MISSRFYLFSLLLFALVLPARAADRVALVIGVNQYEKLPANAQLRVAVSDAELMASSLKALDPAFKVTLLTDVEQNTADEKFEEFLKQAAGAECALLYFAGHGIEYHGANYLLVKDTAISEISPDVELMKRRLGREALSLQAMVDSLDLTGAQVKLVVLDCCRDNPLTATVPGGSRSVVGGRSGLAQVAAPSGTLISYSADAGQKANDGLFTAVLADNLKKPGLTAVQVFATTRDQVREISTEWAEEDAKKGLDPDFRRVRHEPAEYTKLNLAGTNFTFTRGVPEEGKAAESSSSAEMAALRAQLAAAEKLVAESMKNQPATLAKTDPMPAPAFPASRGMEGSRAGEVREFGGIEMVWCPPGEFLMGSPESEEARHDDETQHWVTLTKGFWLAKTECTQEQWQRVMATDVKQQAAKAESKGDVTGEGANHPMYFVSWEDAQAYLSKMNSQNGLASGWKWSLPTEAQWEYACRAGTTAMYVGDVDELAWHCDNSGGKTNPVGMKKANVWGLYDMLGNVVEWCADYHGEYGSGSATDPTGAKSGDYRILRGGSKFFTAFGSRAASRNYNDPKYRLDHGGFRPALVPAGMFQNLAENRPAVVVPSTPSDFAALSQKIETLLEEAEAASSTALARQSQAESTENELRVLVDGLLENKGTIKSSHLSEAERLASEIKTVAESAREEAATSASKAASAEKIASQGKDPSLKDLAKQVHESAEEANSAWQQAMQIEAIANDLLSDLRSAALNHPE